MSRAVRSLILLAGLSQARRMHGALQDDAAARLLLQQRGYPATWSADALAAAERALDLHDLDAGYDRRAPKRAHGEPANGNGGAPC